MNEELKIVIKAVTDSAQKAVKEVSKELEGLGKSAKTSSSKLGAAFKGITKGAAIAVAAIAAIVTALVALGKKSLQAQQEQARLNAAFIAAGASAAQASESYQQLYRFLGDSGKASEAAAHLAKITTNQKHLAEWTKISQGVYATFGDSLPIEGLTEAANETIRVGKVTGTLADALNWAGVSEDEFNAKLATTNSHAEREAMLRSTLNGLYEEAANVYEKNNKALLDYNESQARVDTALAQAGAVITPLLTALNNLSVALLSALKPALEVIIPPIATFVNWIAKAINYVMSFFSALTGKSSSIKAVGAVGGAAAGAAKDLGAAANGASNLGSGMADAEKAAEGAAKAIEEAKKHTQGFDELNIVPSGKTDSGASGGAGGGGAAAGAPGYATGILDPAVFETEVSETENIAGGLVDKVKAMFAKLADVFEPSIKAWSSAFETVKASWENAKPHFINGANEIKEGFTTLGTYLFNEFVPNVVNAFSVNIAPIIGDTFGFLVEEIAKQFEWLAGYFNTFVNDIFLPLFQTIETVAVDIFNIIGAAWQEHGAGLLENFSVFFETIRGHLDNFYNSVFKPIWDNVVIVFNQVWEEGLKPLYEKFVNTVLEIGNELLILYNEFVAPIVDWIITKIFPKIVKVINDVVKTVGKIITAVSKAIGGVMDVIKGLIKFITGVFTGDWKKAWDGIKTIFEGFKTAFSGIIDAVKAVLQGICDFVKGVVVAAFEIAWEAIKAVWSVVANFFKGVWDGIKKAFDAVKTWFKDIFKQAWDGVKNAWSGVTDWFKGIWDKIKNTFSSVKTWFKDTFQGAWQAVQNVFSNWGSFFSGLWNRIKTTFSSLGSNIASAISGSIKSGINGVISMIERTINSAIGLINGAINLINAIPGVRVGTIRTLSLPRLAKGGIVDDATIAMIGEQGKEAVVPLENNTGWMDKLAERIAARQSTPTKVVLQIGEKELGWATINAINGITKQTGGLQLAL